MRSVFGCEKGLLQFSICKLGRDLAHAPTSFESLKTYNLQARTGFRASGGSLYFRTDVLPSDAFTVFVSAASKPEGLKFGFVLTFGELLFSGRGG